MGKHSSPKPGFAKQLVRDLTPAGKAGKAGKRSAGRHSSDAPSTATSVLATVRQRPVVAAIAVPAAATAAVVGSTVVMSPPEAGNVTTEAADTSAQEAKSSPSAVSQDEIDAQREKAGEEYLKDVKDDPKYKNKTSKTTLDVKTPKPKPSPTTEKAETESGGAKSTEEKSTDSDEKSSEGSDTPEGISNEPCSVSSSIESGLQPNAVNGYRAVCAKFPEVKTYGGVRPGSGTSDHYTGGAVDIMITGSTGDRIAEYLIQNSGALNVKYVIWEQRIWNPGSGWSSMEDRGSPTDNHFDHVHVSFN
ncbi:ligand-binding protein SH3 [Brevibacterium sp. UCMA 11752]|uniref:ligand-binding protein SH3 n=1 Tax=Brevibacterium sp. UCMA 11752 TaxID=2745946 RepID=UPI001F28FB1C|nr:ligand-binding protein SH3 [Brevibacterium sp. UCMA 11752]MCF2587671.1 ligand-binding protein SH3 [Brevibacterium sp. UCMA 11752]